MGGRLPRKSDTLSTSVPASRSSRYPRCILLSGGGREGPRAAAVVGENFIEGIFDSKGRLLSRRRERRCKFLLTDERSDLIMVDARHLGNNDLGVYRVCTEIDASIV